MAVEDFDSRSTLFAKWSLQVKLLARSSLLMVAAFLAAAIFRPVAAQAQERCIEFLSPATLPKKAELRKVLPAVHLTNFLPRGGKLLAYSEGRARFMPTVHFALGGPVLDHNAGRWAQKKYAIILPVGDISSQILNVFPQDTFVLGDVKLTKDAHVLVPRGENPGDIGAAQVEYYDPQVPIKTAVKEFLTKHEWLQVSATGSHTEHPVRYHGEDVTGAQYWHEVADNPVPYALHSGTIWGQLDGAVRNAFQWVFSTSGIPVEKEVERARWEIGYLRELLQTADAEVALLKGLPPSALAVYRQSSARVKNFYIKILEYEINLQVNEGKTLLGWNEGRGANILQTLEKEAELEPFISKHHSKFPTLRQAEDAQVLRKALLKLDSIHTKFEEFKETSSLKYGYDKTYWLQQSLDDYQKSMTIINATVPQLNGAFLSSETLRLIEQAKALVGFGRLIALELELRTHQHRTLFGWTAGHAALIQAMTSIPALEAFVRENQAKLPAFQEP